MQCVPSTPAGRNQLLDWAWALSPTERRWGVEGSGMYGRLLAQHLAREREDVYEVSGLATSRERRGGVGVRRTWSPEDGTEGRTDPARRLRPPRWTTVDNDLAGSN